MKEKQYLITLLRLLTYVNRLNYTNKSLTSEFRRYTLPLRHFLNYNNTNKNYYQVKKLKTFFNLVKNILFLSRFRISIIEFVLTFLKYPFTSQNKIF